MNASISPIVFELPTSGSKESEELEGTPGGEGTSKRVAQRLERFRALDRRCSKIPRSMSCFERLLPEPGARCFADPSDHSLVRGGSAADDGLFRRIASVLRVPRQKGLTL